MRRTVLWALAGALVLAVAGGAAASSGKTGLARSSGHAPPKSKLAHPPLPRALVKALTHKRLKAKNTAARPKPAPRTGVRATAHNTASLANVLANAMSSGSFTPGVASFVTTPTNGTPTAVSDESFQPPSFPLDGSSFGILTNGDASAASASNLSTGSGTDDSCLTPGSNGCGTDGDPTTKGANRQFAHDVTILKIPFTIGKGIANVGNCLSLDFRYLSEEYPEYVSSPYNDAFVAELDKNTWTATGASPSATISAPANFAADASGKPVSTNAASSLQMSAGFAAGTTYDGATPLLRASTPVTAGTHTLYLSIFDQSDHFYDSAAFVDNLQLTTQAAGQCTTGAVVDELPADVSVIAKPTAGESTVDYALTVHNDGPAAAENVTLTDALTGVDYASADGADCSADAGTVTCQIGELAAGATLPVTIHTTLTPGGGAFYTDTDVTGSTYDPVLGNNSAYTYDYGGSGSSSEPDDLSVAATAPDAPQGTLVTIPITITNNGPIDYNGSLFTDTYVPKSLSFLGWQLPESELLPDAFDGCFASYDGEISCSFESGFALANGASFEVDVYAYVLRSGRINAESDLYSDANDPNDTNNYAITSFSASPTQFQSSNIGVVQTVSSDFAAQGQPLTYTTKVTNAGPTEATDVGVVDAQPTDTTGTSVSDTLGACTLDDTGGTNCHIDLKSGQSDTITYVVAVAGDAPLSDYVVNFVAIDPTNYFDPSLDDNYWYSFSLIANAPAEKADLVTKVANSPAVVPAGSPVTTTGTVTNKGPAAIADGTLLFSSYYLSVGLVPSLPGNCAWDDSGNLVCDVGPMPKGSTKTVKLVWVPLFGGNDYVYAQAFSTDATWEDANEGNNEASATLTVTQAYADLGIGVLDTVDPVTVGASETWKIAVTNPQGSDPATGVQVVDTLPSGVSLQSASGKGFTCIQAVVITCTLKGALAPGATATIAIVGTVGVAGPLIDTATVTSTSTDIDPSDNTAAVLTTAQSPT